MLSTSRRPRPFGERSPLTSPLANLQSSPIAARRSAAGERRRPAARFDRMSSPVPTDRIDEEDDEEGQDDGDEGDDGDEDENENEDDEEDDDDDDEPDEDDEDNAGETSPLLPIFSAAHLDSLPVYHITHTIRLLIVPRCETTLSWDQLRSPQVSQFLVKPIQQQIRNSHFSKATLYALMANCLQFTKEVQTNPGNSGVSQTRALVSELLAIKLLKEFSTRDLIALLSFHSDFYSFGSLDALSYDFDPLQGLGPPSSGTMTPAPNWDFPSKNKATAQTRAARISSLEIAIRAQSKRFLAHPMVVQQLEAIWAGTVVFHSAADNLHRPSTKVTPNQNRGYGSRGDGQPTLRASPDELQPAKQRKHLEPTVFAIRRSATLYDPRDASLFKLSRLRVPRYRQMLSTCSFAVLLGLYLAVLIERPLHIMPLEIVFWLWSAGFMLDEVVGFNEQGFSLYILSFWNTFDVGILLLLICYYCLRLYGILIEEAHKHTVAAMAYDVLAADAVLLFPRLFSVLDHYRYFSQLLIAFRMMAEDLVAVFILIIISCSGFFVAFTLSFGNADTYDAPGVAYALFQILMGYTPAAWDVWPAYNVLGKIIMTIFLFICHFLIVTILITVLTNSFMAIVQNANEEHQFVFAVNTISMVKSDALFSYVAPANLVAWLLAPLRYTLPFRRFVRINRTVIKVTHFPILLLIYLYERVILSGSFFDTAESVEQRGRTSIEDRSAGLLASGMRVFSPKHGRLREPSVATFRKDKALDEVFRRPFRDNTIRNTERSAARRQTSNVVNGWMQDIGPSGIASPPPEQDHSVIDRLETRRVAHRRSQRMLRRRRGHLVHDATEVTMSVASDPEDFGANTFRPMRSLKREDSSLPAMSIADQTQTEAGDGDGDGDGDDESRPNEASRLTSPIPAPIPKDPRRDLPSDREDYFQQTPRARPAVVPAPVLVASNRKASPGKTTPPVKGDGPRPGHQRARNVSTNTILYDPPAQPSEANSGETIVGFPLNPSPRRTGSDTPVAPSPKHGKRTGDNAVSRARPIMPPRTIFQSAPDLAGMIMFDNPQNRPSSLAMDLGSDIGDNKAIGGGFIGGVPASFATQMAFATGNMRRKTSETDKDDQQRMGKLMLARMNTLEEGFREVLKEVKEWKKEKTLKDPDHETRSADGGGGSSGGAGGADMGGVSIDDFAEMKIGRRKSRNIPNKKPWKPKEKEKEKAKVEEMGQENEWNEAEMDEAKGGEEEHREKGSSV